MEDLVDVKMSGDGFLRVLSAIANIASIITAVIAVWAGGQYLCQRHKKQLRLERHLKEVKENTKPPETIQRTPLQLMAALGIPEAEIIDLSFRSRCIKRVVSQDPMCPIMALEYRSEGSEKPN